jgi:hypothetical protein
MDATDSKRFESNRSTQSQTVHCVHHRLMPEPQLQSMKDLLGYLAAAGESAGPRMNSFTTNTDCRRIVLGAAVGLSVDQVRVFVESLRAVGYTGDVVLLVRWPGIAVRRYLRSRRVRSIPILQVRSFSRSVHARRYAIYAAYLRTRLQQYDQVLLSDVRDVVFQCHPFDGITSPKCHFFLEGDEQTIGGNPTNARWVRGCATRDQVEAVATCRISCSGITIGGTRAILGYLDRMADRIRNIPFRIYRKIGHGYDQGIHNLLVHLSPDIDGIIVQNNGHVATMALEPQSLYRLDAGAQIHTADGRLPAICHQYDRFAEFRAAIEARYAAK